MNNKILLSSAILLIILIIITAMVFSLQYLITFQDVHTKDCRFPEKYHNKDFCLRAGCVWISDKTDNIGKCVKNKP